MDETTSALKLNHNKEKAFRILIWHLMLHKLNLFLQMLIGLLKIKT